MSIVKFSRVISCSSEDPQYPASNLCKSEYTKSWKCKNVGEKQAIVILQLEKSCTICDIDIGNEGSAFVEILVGKSATPDEYEVICVATILTTVQEAKKGEKKNVVHFFKKDDFVKAIASGSWDRIKIICSQPFNKQIKYGLSFVKVHTNYDDEMKTNTSSSSSSTTKIALGKFTLKEDPLSSSPVKVGNFFARYNENANNTTTVSSTAANIRAASNDQTLLEEKKNSKRLIDIIPRNKDNKTKPLVEPPNLPSCSRNSANDLDIPSSSSSLFTRTADNNAKRNKDDDKLVKNRAFDTSSPSTSASFSSQSSSRTPTTSRTLNTPSYPSSSSDRTSKVKPHKNDSNSQDIQNSAKKARKSRDVSNNDNQLRKPFHRLLEGVVFVISGYQNPYRSELRSKALEMGAKYKADWDNTCTHLICAFSNTPKAAVVRGRGWIMKKTWIEDCYDQRKRLCSANYKLEKTDLYTTPNDVEIWEEVDEPAPSSVPESEENEMSHSPTTIHTQAPTNIPNSENDDFEMTEDNNKIVSVYDVETDNDDNGMDVDGTGDNEIVSLPILPDIFSNKKFYLGDDLCDSSRDELKRYIIAYKGIITSEKANVDYIISEKQIPTSTSCKANIVLPDWIWECNDQLKLVPVHKYFLL